MAWPCARIPNAWVFRSPPQTPDHMQVTPQHRPGTGRPDSRPTLNVLRSSARFREVGIFVSPRAMKFLVGPLSGYEPPLKICTSFRAASRGSNARHSYGVQQAVFHFAPRRREIGFCSLRPKVQIVARVKCSRVRFQASGPVRNSITRSPPCETGAAGGANGSPHAAASAVSVVIKPTRQPEKRVASVCPSVR